MTDDLNECGEFFLLLWQEMKVAFYCNLVSQSKILFYGVIPASVGQGPRDEALTYHRVFKF